MRTHGARKPFTLPSSIQWLAENRSFTDCTSLCWTGFFFFLISQYSNQTHTRNNKGICLAILVPPRHQSHYIKKSKLLFITAFQNSSIIQSTQRTFTQWKGFLLSGYTYHLDAKRASFSNIFHGLHELSELFIGKEKQGLYVLPALWRVWKHYTMERKAKEVKLG